ncbi:MAG: SUMF1/EgtB/PvdO family nonheme iron enzyme [Myxococcota bacterium]|jgi:formylglycine-generating enzyme required for sulfatase activity|nr:SUMF1/EgtB/PvdO family nonheme iron enzyme [Myxococcota bacterium]
MLKFVRLSRLLLGVGALFLFLLAESASAVTIDWVTVGGAGNACDTQSQGCFGAVAQSYRISRTEVTNAQYAEFLNAKAVSNNANALYSTRMGSGFAGGITRSGSPGSYTYSAIAGRENKPVNYVSFYDSLRFSNWLNNGQGSGDTETGAYTITYLGIQNNSITRNPGANIFLPSEDEWYKAAYYDAVTTSYFDYPAGSNTQTTCAVPGATANTANCDWVVGDVTDVASYTGSASPNGTFDQGGNVWEWNEAIISGSERGLRGESWLSNPISLAASYRDDRFPSVEGSSMGFRVASIPEPGTGLLLMMGMLGLAIRQRRHV